MEYGVLLYIQYNDQSSVVLCVSLSSVFLSASMYGEYMIQ